MKLTHGAIYFNERMAGLAHVESAQAPTTAFCAIHVRGQLKLLLNEYIGLYAPAEIAKAKLLPKSDS